MSLPTDIAGRLAAAGRRALRRTALALLAGALALGLAAPARAQDSLRVDLPVQFIFTGDVRGASTPSGFIVGFMSDWNIGVAFEKYAVDIDDPSAGIGGVTTAANYTFLDVAFEIRFSAMHVDLGLGTGTASLDDFTVGGQTVSTNKADASQTVLALGWPLGPTWEFHVGYHRIRANADLKVAGATSGQIDLGGVMHSLGFKYSF